MNKKRRVVLTSVPVRGLGLGAGSEGRSEHACGSLQPAPPRTEHQAPGGCARGRSLPAPCGFQGVVWPTRLLWGCRLLGPAQVGRPRACCRPCRWASLCLLGPGGGATAHAVLWLRLALWNEGLGPKLGPKMLQSFSLSQRVGLRPAAVSSELEPTDC